MLRRIGLAALVVLALQAQTRADDAYPIKIKDRGTDETAFVDKTETVVSQTRLVTADGKELVNETKTITESYVYKETYLEREGKKKATRIRREYDKARVQDGDAVTELPYQGKTVLIEKKDGKYHFRLDGGKELTGDDADRLDNEFNQGLEDFDFEKALLPGKPVALDDAWKIDMGTFVKALTKGGKLDADATKATGTGTLRKVYKKDDRQFGAIHFQLEIPVKSFGEGDKKLTLDPGARMAFDVDIDACIDGQAESGTMKATMKMDATAMVPTPDGGKGKLTTSAKNTSVTITREAPKK